MFGLERRKAAAARRTVSEDWIAALPREKSNLFQAVVRQWESSYAMMSVALDGALSLRFRGELVCARQQVFISADLLVRLGATLVVAVSYTHLDVYKRQAILRAAPRTGGIAEGLLTERNVTHWNLNRWTSSNSACLLYTSRCV